jgi:hypothetical protein
MTTTTYKLPTISELYPLVKAVKADICDDYRCSDDPDDSTPGITLTVGANEEGDWSYQTGDNSYTGGAYGYPHWAVVYIYRNSNCREIAREILSELGNLMAQ